jgi:hypothetical protein
MLVLLYRGLPNFTAQERMPTDTLVDQLGLPKVETGKRGRKQRRKAVAIQDSPIQRED